MKRIVLRELFVEWKVKASMLVDKKAVVMVDTKDYEKAALTV